ncbi:hypothetical protein J4418_00975 [Candidatus Woesearchaeota archaeon]|nr:hypothetical protein [Candidatus Woesearchaeota archaeon]
MKESLRDALEEIKRVDHLIYVSLKYTRTVDVIKSIVQRMVDAMDFLIMANLLTEKESTAEIFPQHASERARLLKSNFPQNNQLQDYLEFYLLLRKVLRAKYTASQEFRRHVTMSVNFTDADENLDINIDLIYEYYEKLKNFFDYTYQLVENAEKTNGKETP